MHRSRFTAQIAAITAALVLPIAPVTRPAILVPAAAAATQQQPAAAVSADDIRAVRAWLAAQEAASHVAHVAHVAHVIHRARVALEAGLARAARIAARAKITRARQAAAARITRPHHAAKTSVTVRGEVGQYGCLDRLWEHESGWDVHATNPGSGAYGIPQALPGAKMATAGADWQTSAATQIRWGLTYIAATYGSPCGAWGHEQSSGWY